MELSVRNSFVTYTFVILSYRTPLPLNNTTHTYTQTCLHRYIYIYPPHTLHIPHPHLAHNLPTPSHTSTHIPAHTYTPQNPPSYHTYIYTTFHTVSLCTIPPYHTKHTHTHTHTHPTTHICNHQS